MNPGTPAPREETGPFARFLSHPRMKQLGGLIFLLLALWINKMTDVADRLRPTAPASSPHTTPSFIHGFAIEMILTIVAVGFSIAAFRGRLRLAPGIVAFLVLLGSALAVGYFR